MRIATYRELARDSPDFKKNHPDLVDVMENRTPHPALDGRFLSVTPDEMVLLKTLFEPEPFFKDTAPPAHQPLSPLYLTLTDSTGFQTMTFFVTSE